MCMNQPTKTILLVDDDEFIRQIIRTVLHRSNHKLKIIEANNGRTGMTLAQVTRPDLAIIDVVMPIMNGEELSKELKKLYPNLPILILTGFDNPESKKRLLEEIGVNSYLSKTMDYNSIYKEVSKLLL